MGLTSLLFKLSTNALNATPLHCPIVDGMAAVSWIEYYFADCVYTTRDLVSFYVGLASICCWLCAQAPQLCVARVA